MYEELLIQSGRSRRMSFQRHLNRERLNAERSADPQTQTGSLLLGQGTGPPPPVGGAAGCPRGWHPLMCVFPSTSNRC